MKVLLVTMYFPPAGGGGVGRPVKLATHLPELGIETHVLAPADPKAKFNLEWALRALGRETPPPPPEESEPGESSEPPDAEAAAPEPQQEPEQAPSSAAPEQGPAEPSQASEPRPDLSPEDVARWLDAVRDQPLPAFRQKLGESAGPRTGPQW